MGNWRWNTEKHRMSYPFYAYVQWKYSCKEMELDKRVVCGSDRLVEKLSSCTFLSSLHCILSYWMWGRNLFEQWGSHGLQLIILSQWYFNIQLLHRKTDSISSYCHCFLVELGNATQVHSCPQEKSIVSLGMDEGWRKEGTGNANKPLFVF